MKKKYFSEEEKKVAHREACHRYDEKNKENKSKYGKQYYQDKKEDDEWIKKHQENTKSWREKNPIKYRASNLVSAYKQQDRKYDRGENDLTAKWIIENIFTQPCVYCGKTGWDVIGCNRLDNSLPHTMDNVEPCCAECNKKLAGEEKRACYQAL